MRLGTDPFLVDQPFEKAIVNLTDRLISRGFHMLVTFDLPGSSQAGLGCTCPHHGSDACTCRLSFILIYGLGTGPVSMLAHGSDGKTWLSLVDTPQQPVDPAEREQIQCILDLVASP